MGNSKNTAGWRYNDEKCPGTNQPPTTIEREPDHSYVSPRGGVLGGMGIGICGECGRRVRYSRTKGNTAHKKIGPARSKALER